MADSPPSPDTTPAKPAPVVSTAVRVVDLCCDVIAAGLIAMLCHDGKISGEVAVIAIGALMGLQNGVRVLGSRGATPGVGVAGLILLAALGGSALRHASTAAAAAEAVHQAGRHV